MKTLFKHLSALLLTVAWSSSLTAAIPDMNDAGNSAGQNEVVKAKMIDGVWMPVVDLPEIEITASRFGGTIYKGTLNVNGLLVQINLPEVVIEGKSLTVINSGKEVISDSNLPVIEICAPMPVSELTPIEVTESGLIAKIELPEVVIEGNSGFPSDFNILKLADILEKGLAFNLNENDYRLVEKISHPFPESILITAKQCFRQEGQKLVCNVSVMVTSKMNDSGVSEKILRMILNRE
jgi:hypothetical protein